jgi:mannose-6-phosphate isomerase-like protein (cupin superfamily)
VTYGGQSGEASAVYRQAGAIAPLMLGATKARFVAPGSLTGGRFGLYHWGMPGRSGGASPHFHRTFSESFYVIGGKVDFFDGNEWRASSPGDFLYVPEGGIHGFRNEADEAASMLILFAPGPPRERYFEELAEIIESGRQLSQEEWTELYARHDQYMV